jgi:hypothetical protein
MSAQEIINEFKSLPEAERGKVKKFFHELEASEIPESFWRGLQEADEGRTMELREEHFDNPPA